MSKRPGRYSGVWLDFCQLHARQPFHLRDRAVIFVRDFDLLPACLPQRALRVLDFQVPDFPGGVGRLSRKLCGADAGNVFSVQILQEELSRR